MKNREITYYTILDRASQQHMEQLADTMDVESFIALRYDVKWYGNLWIPENNECFLELLRNQTDIRLLDRLLSDQLRLYVKKHDEGCEQEVYKAQKDWLKHTIFICKNEYNKTHNEIFAEVVKLCEDWLNEWSELFNPIKSPESKNSEHNQGLGPNNNLEDPFKGLTNEFNGMPLNQVLKYFMQLVESNSKNGKPFLTKDEVINFIKRGFYYEDGIDKLSINYSRGEGAAIIELFYNYFSICRNEIENTKQCQDKYIGLLTANFTGWEEDKVRNNFNKHINYKWKIKSYTQLSKPDT